MIKRKQFYSKEDNNSFDDDDSDSDNESERVLFLAMDAKEVVEEHDESEEEGKVDLDAELVSALEELDKARKKNKLLKKELSRIRKDIQDSTYSKELKQAHLDLKVQWEEAKVIEESLRKQLEEK